MSPYELVEKGMLLDAARLIDRLPERPPNLVVLRTLLESSIGSPEHAASDAKRLLRQPLDARERGVCWEVIGRVALATGQVADGLRAMKQAFTELAALHDARAEARLLAVNVRSLLESVGVESASLEMSRLRQAAVRAADPFALIEFHSIDAEIKIKRGLFASAASTISSALSLLGRFPNVAQQGRLAVLSSGMAILQGDYESGAKDAAEALSCAQVSGLRTVRLPALNNVIQTRLAQRQLMGLEHHLNEFMTSSLKGGSSEIGQLDTHMMFALASDDTVLAGELAVRILGFLAKRDDRSSYYALWHFTTRIRWLLRTGNKTEAIKLALEAVSAAERTLDRGLAARLKLLAADGLARTTDIGQANALILEAVGAGTVPSVELMAEAFRVAGRLSAPVDSEASITYFDRAERMLTGLGNITARREVDRDARETLGAAWDAACINRRRETPSSDDAARLCRLAERFGTLVELGAHVPTLAIETAAVIADAGITSRCVLTASRGQGPEETLISVESPESSTSLHDEVLRIDFGMHRDRQFQISCTPRADTPAHTTLMAIQRLANAAIAVTKLRQVEQEKAAAVWSERSPEQQLGVICSSESMLDLVKTIRRVAISNTTVLLTGETGVGKELFARALHQASQRSERQFLPFNCSTVPREMFDGQLFGHKRGSFTGAIADSAGVIRSAAGGTLFLDEIGEMTLESQPKLLRFLESGEILPLGETKPQYVDVRIVAATNANLDQLVADGRFREDLFYRLNVVRINIPPLRERREEIPALVGHFLGRFGEELQKPLLRVADETLEYLVLYRWPGNVRQLANEIRRLVAMAEPGSVIMPAHLASDIAESRRTLPANRSPRLFDEVVTRIDQPLSAVVEHVERAAIQRALAMTDGHLDEAARMLGLSRKGLYLKRQRLNLG